MSTNSSFNTQAVIGIVGLGYVGLPLALAFSEYFSVVGFDTDAERIAELKNGIDRNKETETSALASSEKIKFTHNCEDLNACQYYIVTVPTPVDEQKIPDLQLVKEATTTLGKMLKPKDIVIYESTVYPGCTEEVCIPILEKLSGLICNQDFGVGYSPERINPGDKERHLKDIVKITSGSDLFTAQKVQSLYATIITAGLYPAPSIKVAEAAKAIENAQRDLNISFMNELALMFYAMGIDIHEVLKAAQTKWNFLPFSPGLVGGHCIGVDPHYLVYQARQKGYEPKVILSGREVNDSMGVFLAQKMIAALAEAHQGNIRDKTVLILGLAFKPNCADTRNTKVVDVYHALVKAGLQVSVYDPWVSPSAAKAQFNIDLVDQPQAQYDGIIHAVKHTGFKELSIDGTWVSL